MNAFVHAFRIGFGFKIANVVFSFAEKNVFLSAVFYVVHIIWF